MHLRLEADIAAPADKTWNLLGTQFAEIDTWATVIKTSRPIGADEVPASMMVAREPIGATRAGVVERARSAATAQVADILRRRRASSWLTVSIRSATSWIGAPECPGLNDPAWALPAAAADAVGSTECDSVGSMERTSAAMTRTAP